MKIQRDTLLGLVFFGGLALAGWASVNLTDISVGEERHEVVVYFDNAQGLRNGDPVFVLGTRSGQVKEVALTTEDRQSPIRVTLELAQELPQLKSDRVIEITQASLLGGSQVNINPGSEGTELPAKGDYEGRSNPGALAQLGDADLTGTVDAIKSFFVKLADPNGSVGALLADRQPFDDLSATLASARRTMEEVEKGEGPLGQIIHSREMADDLTSGVREFSEIIHKINEGQGLAARVINDADMAADVSTALDDISHLTSSARRGEGMLGRLIASTDTAIAFDETLESIRSVAGKLDDPEAGLLPALIGDPEMRRHGQELMANLSETSEKINNGDGLLGKLINDPEMAEQVDRVIKQVAGAIEDARESAPVGTFFQVLASPF